MERVQMAVVYTVVCLIICGLIYGGFWVNRAFSYSFGYQDQVVETVCSMVKREHLINPDDC